MATVWRGSICLDSGRSVEDVVFSCAEPPQNGFPKEATLRFLSLVEIARIPLHLSLGTRYEVTTACPETETWFSKYLLVASHQGDGESESWWESARVDSPLGILVSVEAKQPLNGTTSPRATELLLYASRAAQRLEQTRPGAEQALNVHALALSSDLAYQTAEPTPPSSPTAEDVERPAVFLPLTAATAPEIINEPPVKKRKSASDVFHEATERRRRADRKGGESVAAAAAVKTEDLLPGLKHRRSISGLANQSIHLQTLPLSRSPSVVSSRPTTARASSEAPKRSSLSRAPTTLDRPGEATVESKNKELISRIIMAGMRLYGLSQSKNRKYRTSSAMPSVAAEISSDQQETERQMDEEYKLTYHQIFKGTCFAFRQHMTVTDLHSSTEALRDTVDKLLALFCNDPLTAGKPGTPDGLTPSGRRAFGSALHTAVKGQDTDGEDVGNK